MRCWRVSRYRLVEDNQLFAWLFISLNRFKVCCLGC